MNRVKLDLQTRPPVVERPDREPCGICRRQISRYTCPTCNLPYCSLTCFRAEAHSNCSESFYRREIELDIKTAPQTSVEERSKMLALLRQFEEENAAEPDELEEEEDKDDLAKKLEAIDLDEADPDAIWSMLSPSQRDSFLKAVRDPSSELAQQLLSSVELEQKRQKPWWKSPLLENEDDTSESKEYGVLPKMMSIPQSLIAPEMASESSRFLLYNILALCLAYAYVTRRIAMSPLSALKTNDADHTVAQDLLSHIVPFVTDRKSKLLFKSVDNVVTYIWSKLEALSDTPTVNSFSVLLTDASTIFQPQRIAVISQDDTNSPVSRTALLAISDIAAFLTPQSAKLKSTLHKLNFYAAYLYVQNPEVLRMVAEECHIACLTMESRPLA